VLAMVADSPCDPMLKRKKSSAQRRDQKHRAEARRLQSVAKILESVTMHRGNMLSTQGVWLLSSLEYRLAAPAEHSVPLPRWVAKEAPSGDVAVGLGRKTVSFAQDLNADSSAVVANPDVVMDAVVMENDTLATLASKIQPASQSPSELQASEEAKKVFSVLANPGSWNDSKKYFDFSEHDIDFDRMDDAHALVYRNGLKDLIWSAAHLQDNLQKVRRDVVKIQEGTFGGVQITFVLLPILQQIEERRIELNLHAEKMRAVYLQWLSVARISMSTEPADDTFVEE